MLQGQEAPGAKEISGAFPPIKIPLIWYLAPFGSALALLTAYIFYRQIMNASEGDAAMIEVARAIRTGAYAYLKRQYKVVAIVFAVLCVLLALQAFVAKAQNILVPFAFLTGGFFSGLAGFIGMKTATNASHRTTEGAKESLNRGLTIAFRAGAVMGLVVVGLSLLHISAWFLLLAKVWGRIWVEAIPWQPMGLNEITVVMLCFGMGASMQALFARVGGGIFTKAADVGADLVGKIEAGIPEDDPRNPATIADNVGDNVGDVAGMGADLFESYTNSILAASVLGAAAASSLGLGHIQQVNFVVAPMMIAGIGVVASVVSTFFIRTKEEASQKSLLWALRRAIWGSSIITLAAIAFLIHLVLPRVAPGTGILVSWSIFAAVAIGLLAGILIGWFTEYYTSQQYKPVRWLSRQSETGPATVILGGISSGMLSTSPALATVTVAMLAAFTIAGGFKEPQVGLYGVGIAAVGLLSTLGITLASDAYGPVADNAGGNAEMTHQKPEVRQRTDALDSLGNTTAATGKGFAIASAALTALALLAAYVEEVRIGLEHQAAAYIQKEKPGEEPILYSMGSGKYVEASRDPETGSYSAYILSNRADAELREVSGQAAPVRVLRIRDASLKDLMSFYNVTLMSPRVLAGLFLGVLLVFSFCGLTMKAVGRNAGRIVEEVRRQFRELKILTDPTAKPDYARCVEIATTGAQKEMVLPSLLAGIGPIVVGLFLDVPGVMGLLGGALASGFAMAIFMANAGGAWDNAKKLIEGGELGGKGSDAHKAAIVGDTVGDPFKDTSGPSLNILIKLMAMVSVVFAGLTVKFAPMIGNLLR